jgi:protein-disulfide isomerase
MDLKRSNVHNSMMPLGLAAVLGFAGAALPGGSAVAQGATESAASGDTSVVATIGSQRISQSALDSFVAPQLMELRQQRQQVLEQGLDRYLDREVVDREAKARGMTPSDLVKKEVTSKVKEPTDAEVDAFYEGNKDRISAPKAQVVGQIKQYLMQQKEQQAFTAYANSLKTKYGVKVLLKPLRVDIDTQNEPARGPADAAVTLVEFGDFQCPYCARLEPTLKEVVKHYAGKVRLVFRQFPLQNIHPHAQVAAEASLCAREQGKFWQLHDAMYANQDALTAKDLKATAAKLGMNAKQFDACLDGHKYNSKIQADMKAGEQAGVNGTPALFVNGRPVPGGAVAYDVLAKVIDDELSRRQASAGAG